MVLYGFEQLILYYASHAEQEESEEKSGYFMLKKMLDKRKNYLIIADSRNLRGGA